MATALPDWFDREPGPTYAGPVTRCWKLPPHPEPSMVYMGAGYLVYAPQAHPAWTWHFMGVVSLADREGLPPAHRQYPEAEYEVMVLALDPNEPVPYPPEFWRPHALRSLTPPDVVEQFHNVPGGERAALRLLDLLAEDVAYGRLIPDSDWRTAWREAISEHLDAARVVAR